MPDKRSLDEVSTIAAGDDSSHDSFDDLLVRVVRAGSAGGTSADGDDLAIGTELAGRFTIQRVIGSGGMGTVYVALDQSLGREVALKVHHTAGGATRLRREAIAMARLAHPNVVTVFEVGEIARRPFVVMELITGLTLRAWVAAAPRTWREILTMCLAAGEGLAAAHAAGLVHRDFKPENVLVGDDGRVRVGDFGLARELDSKDDPPLTERAATDKLMTAMTQTGAVLGTPAYMAPEQFTGQPVDPRADQFAFCVTVWEALWGQRPYPGSTFELVAAAIETGTRTPMPHGSRVPVSVRSVLERGLAKDPEKRYPNMRALLDSLRATLRRRRAVVLAAVGAVAIVAALVAFAMMRGPEGDRMLACQAAGTEIDSVVIDAPNKLRSVGQADAAARLQAALQTFAMDYRSTAQKSCEMQRDWSAEMFAKSQACLMIAGRAARLALPLDNVTAADAPKLLQTAGQLPPSLHKCVEPSYLAAARPVPGDPVELDALVAARAELQAALEDAGGHGRAVIEGHLKNLEASRASDDPTVAAGMLYVRGMLARDRGEVVEAEKLFADAYYSARAIDDDDIASSSLISMIAETSDALPDPPQQKVWMRAALADAARMKSRSPLLASQIYANVAHYADLAGDLRGARSAISDARALLTEGSPGQLEVMSVEAALDMETGHVDAGVATYRKAIAMQTKRLGPDHLRVGMMNADFATLLLEVDRPDDALQASQTANAIIGKIADRGDPMLADAKMTLGAVMVQLERPDDARVLLDEAKAAYIAMYGAKSPAVAKCDTNLAVLESDADHIDKSVALNEEALAIDEATLGPDRLETGEVLYNLVVGYRKQKAFDRALTAITRCQVIFAAKLPDSPRLSMAIAMTAAVQNDLRLWDATLDTTTRGFAIKDATEQVKGWLRIERARALINLQRDGAEARRLLDEAKQIYSGLNMTARVAEVDGLSARVR